MKQEKGITILALIITIIVMLILVGVVITVTIDKGLFETAQDAAKDTIEESYYEKKLTNGKIQKSDGSWVNLSDYRGGASGENSETSN